MPARFLGNDSEQRLLVAGVAPARLWRDDPQCPSISDTPRTPMGVRQCSRSPEHEGIHASYSYKGFGHHGLIDPLPFYYWTRND